MGCYPSNNAVHSIGEGVGSEPPSPTPPTCCSASVSRSVRVKVKEDQGWVQANDRSQLAGAGQGQVNEITAEHDTKVQSDAPMLPGTMGDLCVANGAEETPFSPPSPTPTTTSAAPDATSSTVDPPEPPCASATVVSSSPTLPTAAASLSPAPTHLAPLKPRYGASVSVGGGQYVPVGSGLSAIPMAQKLDFEREKAKIEEEFTKLEEQLDSGTKDREEIEKEFDALTRKADTLRRLEDAEMAACRAQLVPRATQLAPVRIAALPGGRNPNIPSMAVVHWKKVTKEQYEGYKAVLIEKYGSGTDKIKTIQKIPNRILITAPMPAVMEKILADVELDPRPEPYEMPGSKK